MIDVLSLQKLQQRYGGYLLHEHAELMFEAVSTDTRNIHAGDIFIALVGDQFDAHNFLSLAVEKGAAALVVSTPVDNIAIPQWVVDDTTIALGHIAQYHRELFSGVVVGITGSSGKTTVKGMLQSIFQTAVGQDRVFATHGNLNNQFGVPLSLLSLAVQHDYAVIEMGASAVGDIDYLTDIAKPDVALVNNVMPAHIEGFGSLENIAIGKGEIFNGLNNAGIAAINLDDAFASQWLVQNQRRKIVGFSIDENNSHAHAVSIFICAKDIQQTNQGFAEFLLSIDKSLTPVSLSILGVHNVANALAASACAHALGISNSNIARGLEQFSTVSGRMKAMRGFNDCQLIDDSYNANPGSVKAAVDVLSSASSESYKVFVLGHMAELGEYAEHEHEQLGLYMSTQHVDKVLVIGDYAEAVAKSLGDKAICFKSIGKLIDEVKALASNNTIFLIKGSRSSHMERVVQALQQSGDDHVTLAS